MNLAEKSLFCVTGFIFTEAQKFVKGKDRFRRQSILFCAYQQHRNKSRCANCALYESALVTMILPHDGCTTVFSRDRGIPPARSTAYDSAVRRIRHAYQTSVSRLFSPEVGLDTVAGLATSATYATLKGIHAGVSFTDLRRAFLFADTKMDRTGVGGDDSSYAFASRRHGGFSI